MSYELTLTFSSFSSGGPDDRQTQLLITKNIFLKTGNFFSATPPVNSPFLYQSITIQALFWIWWTQTMFLTTSIMPTWKLAVARELHGIILKSIPSLLLMEPMMTITWRVNMSCLKLNISYLISIYLNINGIPRTLYFSSLSTASLPLATYNGRGGESFFFLYLVIGGFYFGHMSERGKS